MISSHYLVKHDSGIIELILNVHHRAFSVSQRNDITYEINNEDYSENGNPINVPIIEDFPIREVVEIPEIESLFDKENHIVYSGANSCCKDQYIFYWIPISLLGMQRLQEKHTESRKICRNAHFSAEWIRRSVIHC